MQLREWASQAVTLLGRIHQEPTEHRSTSRYLFLPLAALLDRKILSDTAQPTGGEKSKGHIV